MTDETKAHEAPAPSFLDQLVAIRREAATRRDANPTTERRNVVDHLDSALDWARKAG